MWSYVKGLSVLIKNLNKAVQSHLGDLCKTSEYTFKVIYKLIIYKLMNMHKRNT